MLLQAWPAGITEFKQLIMKNLILILVTALVTFASCSYEPGVSEAFTKYRFKDGVTTVTVPGWVLAFAARHGDLDKEEREILKNIEKVKVLAVEDNDLNARINLHKEFYDHINRKGDYDELLVVRDEKEEVTIFGKMDEEVITEMVILVGGEDNAMVYLKGEISPDLLNDKIDLSDPKKIAKLNFK